MKSKAFAAARTFLLVFDKGDDVPDALRRFAAEEKIEGATFSAIGAFERATIAYWNRETLEYEDIEVSEQVEVLSFLGDIGVHEGEYRIHAHVVLGRRDGSTIGGHLISGRVFPTLELELRDLGGRIRRATDAATRLSLIDVHR